MSFSTTSNLLVEAANRQRRVRPNDHATKALRALGCLVATEFGCHRKALFLPTRGHPCEALARQVAMYLAHVGYEMSFAAIGRAFGRDRTTVAHACRVVEDMRDDPAFESRVACLERACAIGELAILGAVR